MKKILNKKLAIIVAVFLGILIFLGISRYYNMYYALKYFGAFYSQDEINILKENIFPIHKTISSGNYKVSLKGVWVQGNCTDFIFKINALDGNKINEEGIKYSVRNIGEINEESGDIALFEEKYKEGNQGSGLLEIKRFGGNNNEKFNIEIEMEKELFSFIIPQIQKQEMKHFIIDEKNNSECLIEDIYLSSLSIYYRTNKEDIDISDKEININYTDGLNQMMELSEGYVGTEDEKGNGKMYIQFLERVIDTEKIKTISVGEIKYKNIER